MTYVDPLPSQKQKHPIGLRVIFLTEVWERFGYYGMLAVFVLYLHYHLRMPIADAASMYGWYGGLSYFTSLLGGFIADRYLGYRRSVIIGATLLSAGYLLLGLSASNFSFLTKQMHSILLYGSVYGALILGHGFFKPNQTTLVGNLYAQGDPRKDSAYSIFYMAINIGAFVSPIIACLIGFFTGSWALIFAICGIGMFIGLITFILFQHHLESADRPSHQANPQSHSNTKVDDREPPQVEKQRIQALFIMCAIVVAFWMAFQQNGSTLNFWAVKNTDIGFLPSLKKLQDQAKEEERVEIAREQQMGEEAYRDFLSSHLQKISLPAQKSFFLAVSQSFEKELKKNFGKKAYAKYVPELSDSSKKKLFLGVLYESVNPFFIVVFTPLVVWIFASLRKKRKEPSTPGKLAIGMLLTALAFGIMVIASLVGGNQQPNGEEGMVNPLWLASSYMVITLGELCLSPMGLSMVTKLAPKRMLSLMFGVWQLFTAIGMTLAGKIGVWWDQWPHHQFFGFLVITSLLSAFLLFVLLDYLKKAMPPETSSS